MALWKARVEFMLSVIELFLCLTVETIQGKCFKTRCLQEGVGQIQPRFQGKGSYPCQCIDTTRKVIEIDCATTLLLAVFYNETLPQTSRPLLSNLV